MINKNSEIDGIEKAEENIDNQPLSNEKIVQSSTKLVPIAPKNKKSKYWFLFKLMIFFLLLNVAIEIVRNLGSNANCGGVNKCNGLEAKLYVDSMNRAQQAYFAENGRFGNSVDELGVGIKTKTNYFNYSVISTETAGFSYGIPHQDSFKTVYFGLLHWNKKVELRGYVGAVFLIPVNNGNPKEVDNITSLAIMCITESPSKIQPPNPILDNGKPTCANGTDEVTR